MYKLLQLGNSWLSEEPWIYILTIPITEGKIIEKRLGWTSQDQSRKIYKCICEKRKKSSAKFYKLNEKQYNNKHHKKMFQWP